MKRTAVAAVFLAAAVGLADSTSVPGQKGVTPMKMIENITWLGQSTVRIKAAGKTIYIDPYQISKREPADIILVTHAHADHLSLKDIAKLATGETVFVAPRDCASKIQTTRKTDVCILKPGEDTQIGDIRIEATYAYNVVKTKFHPRKNNWVGYILTVDGVRIYHAGDTERIPEMTSMSCDIAMLPLGQTYTMNSVADAAAAAVDVNAKIAIPIHYGMYEGKLEDAEEFKRLLEGKVKVVIKEHAAMP
jgi:L-ascorbate metabolism protein UlaG (beta-lactamase superfamily)